MAPSLSLFLCKLGVWGKGPGDRLAPGSQESYLAIPFTPSSFCEAGAVVFLGRGRKWAHTERGICPSHTASKGQSCDLDSVSGSRAPTEPLRAAQRLTSEDQCDSASDGGLI